MNYELAQLLAEPWLIQASDFQKIVVPMVSRVSAATPDVKAMEAVYAGRDRGPIMLGDVAVINVSGPIIYQSSWFSMYFGAAAITDLQDQFNAALADPAVKTIVFRVNSPGGTITGVPEFADQIFRARGQGKTILAVADKAACSAAYWLTAMAELVYATQTSVLGAVGVYCTRMDISAMLEKMGLKEYVIAHGKNKAQGIESQPMTDAEQASLQSKVDLIGGWFDTDVARGRGVGKSVVLDTFGQGDTFFGGDAISKKLADKNQSFGQLLSRLTKGRVSADAARAAISVVVPMAASKDATVETDAESPAAAGKTHKAGMGSRQDDGCNVCSEACPCDQDETCPEDCPDCDEDCPCRGKAKASAAAADDGEEAAILAALTGKS